MKAETLRKSILQYAMEGKLVPQNPDDEPACELLKRIKTEKEQLIKEGKLKKEKPLPPITDEEKPFELPQGWEWVRVSDVSVLYNGKAFKPSDWSSKGLPIVRIQNLNNKLAEYNYYDGLIDEIHLLKGNELLFAWSGTPGTSFGAHIWHGSNAVLNQHIFKINFNEDFIYKKFFMYALNQRIEELISKAHGAVGLQHVTKRVFEQTLIPLPPREEQKRIVEKLEEILPLVDEYGKNEELLSEMNSKLPKQIRQSILQYAVQGKLVEQNPNDEPASELLKRIKSEKEQLIKDGKLKKEKPLPPITEDEKPFELPQGWEWVRLGDIGLSNIGLTYKPTDIVTQGGIPVLRSSNIQNSKIDLSDLVRVTTEIKNENLFIELGDILICARNGSKNLVGKSAIIDELKEPMTFGAFMAVFRTKLNLWVQIYLSSPLFKNTLSSVNTVTINQITQNNLKNAIIPLPPLEEQKRIVAKVDELMKIVDMLEC